MAWYWIALITVIAVHAFNTAVILFSENVSGSFDSGTVYMIVCFLVWFPLWVLMYPFRASYTYKKSSGYYQKRGISYWGYMFGKREKRSS